MKRVLTLTNASLEHTTSESVENVPLPLEIIPKLLPVLQAKAFVAANTHQGVVLPAALVQEKDFWRHMFSVLTDDAMISFAVEDSTVTGLLKMSGFVDVQSNGEGVIVARKPAFKAGGTSLKKKKVEVEKVEDNPWENLQQQNVQIDEDALMEEAGKTETVAFANECDRIMPGKPCDNCSCGKKELYEAAGGIAALENGQVESSCGKCYLGDAFRCASCPYLGKPAFEAGDKVKLQNASVAQSKTETENVAVKDTGSTKVQISL